VPDPLSAYLVFASVGVTFKIIFCAYAAIVPFADEIKLPDSRSVALAEVDEIALFELVAVMVPVTSMVLPTVEEIPGPADDVTFPTTIIVPVPAAPMPLAVDWLPPVTDPVTVTLPVELLFIPKGLTAPVPPVILPVIKTLPVEVLFIP
jgi:hypothetical protein